MPESGYAPGAMTLAPLSFSFTWDEAEHRRLLRDISRHRERSVGERVFWWAAGVLLVMGATGVVTLFVERGIASRLLGLIPWLVIMALWVLFFRWVIPHTAAKQFRRQHPGADDRFRIGIGLEGLRMEWETGSATVKWTGVRRVVETEEFFLFYQTPNCAQFLPKRAVESAAEREALRRLIRREMGGAAELREG